MNTDWAVSFVSDETTAGQVKMSRVESYLSSPYN